MTPNEYQKAAYEFALPRARNITYMTLGLCSETGEVVGKLKKVLRGDRKWDEQIAAMSDELGDVAFYLAGLATQCNLNLEEIFKANIQKLQSRQQRGKLQGDGDTR